MIAIVDTGVANIRSVANAVERSDRAYCITREASSIAQASHVILPGVGHARASMLRLEQLQLIETIRNLKQPVLGICLGMQILYEKTAEGPTDCLAIIPGQVEQIKDFGLSLPHIGWNTLQFSQAHSPLLEGLQESCQVYFVHSFRAPMTEATQAFTEYGEKIPAVVSFKNFHGTQFHPERSGPIGQRIIRNFFAL
ncbi:MAG: imidazole glycerol phosphate synthase subunit HisH [Proteobacteria bacterium]|nr:imidazole glycerol phosphate synthase subunit HisH [Pseudomonadota bacterium]